MLLHLKIMVAIHLQMVSANFFVCRCTGGALSHSVAPPPTYGYQAPPQQQTTHVCVCIT